MAIKSSKNFNFSFVYTYDYATDEKNVVFFYFIYFCSSGARLEFFDKSNFFAGPSTSIHQSSTAFLYFISVD